MPKVIEIPAIQKETIREAKASCTKRRVAGYARVSTDHDEQINSYEAQIDYYTNYIRSNSGWEFVEVYTEMLTPSLIQMHPTCTQIAP